MEDWKNTKCGNCVIQRKKPICNSCMEYSHFQPMSNADKIRAMSDEELAEFLESFEVCTNCEYKEKTIGLCTFDNICTHGFATAMALKWLQSEADTKGE